MSFPNRAEEEQMQLRRRHYRISEREEEDVYDNDLDDPDFVDRTTLPDEVDEGFVDGSNHNKTVNLHEVAIFPFNDCYFTYHFDDDIESHYLVPRDKRTETTLFYSNENEPVAVKEYREPKTCHMKEQYSIICGKQGDMTHDNTVCCNREVNYEQRLLEQERKEIDPFPLLLLPFQLLTMVTGFLTLTEAIKTSQTRKLWTVSTSFPYGIEDINSISIAAANGHITKSLTWIKDHMVLPLKRLVDKDYVLGVWNMMEDAINWKFLSNLTELNISFETTDMSLLKLTLSKLPHLKAFAFRADVSTIRSLAASKSKLIHSIELKHVVITLSTLSLRTLMMALVWPDEPDESAFLYRDRQKMIPILVYLFSFFGESVEFAVLVRKWASQHDTTAIYQSPTFFSKNYKAINLASTSYNRNSCLCCGLMWCETCSAEIDGIHPSAPLALRGYLDSNDNPAI
jgi:hypothetical protein